MHRIEELYRTVRGTASGLHRIIPEQDQENHGLDDTPPNRMYSVTRSPRMTASLHTGVAIACVNYSTKTNHDNFYACANGINDGKYAYNNLQHYDATWYHRFNAKWHMATEAWYMYEREVPNVAGNVANPVPTELGANGAYCAAGELRCNAPEYAVRSRPTCAKERENSRAQTGKRT